jgi:hypothetical protein
VDEGGTVAVKVLPETDQCTAGDMVVFGVLRDAFSRGWLLDGSFAIVKPEPMSLSSESYDGSCIDSLLTLSSSSEGEEGEPETSMLRRREVEAIDAHVWLDTYDNTDGQRGVGAATAQPCAQLRLRQRP